MANSLKPVINVSGNKLLLENLILLQSPIKTFSTADLSSASSTMGVKNSVGFASTGSQVVIVGEPGNEGTEILLTSSITTNVITFSTNTVFPHSSGTPVYLVDADQVEFSNAATLAGAKTVLSTSNIQVDSQNTAYSDTSGNTGFYFARFKNTITGLFSVYSSGVPTTGYGITTARSIIDNALGMMNKLPSNLLTDQYSFQQINNCQQEVLRELKRWSFLQVFDYSLGQLTTGTWKIAVPTDLDDQFSNRSVYNFRIGTGDNLRWADKEKWNDITSGSAHTTLSVAIAVSDATVTLTDASNFPDAGTLYIGANTYPYTSINRTTNVVTLTSVSTTTNTINSDVFLGATFGTPEYWTIFGGYLYFYPVLSSSLNQREGLLDYYKTPVTISNDSDTTVLIDPTVAQYYLAWKLKLRQNNGTEDDGSKGFYDKFILRRDKLVQKETLGKTFKFKPVLNSLDESGDIDSRDIRTGNFSGTGF